MPHVNVAIAVHLLSNLGGISGRQDFKVVFQGARLNHGVEPISVKGLPERDVFSDGQILNPRLLRDVGHWATQGERPRDLLHLPCSDRVW